MLKKEQRLSRDKFNSIFASGKRIHSDAFSLIYSPTTDVPCASVVVSKKVAGGVIARNLLKRKLYNVIKTNLVHDTILLTKKGIKGKSFEELVEIYNDLLTKAK
tara:strand:+ start:622 stop:933 length:312 start_codon:yes stop_codon:yes gene_type:complete